MKKLCITIGPEWPMAKAEFERVGLVVEPFQAIVEENRVLAFNKSVYECMKIAQGGDLLLFEDDVAFDSYKDFTPPYGALTVHLGCNLIGTNTTVWDMPVSYSDEFARLRNCWQSHATWYSKNCVDYIINNFKYVTDEYVTAGCQIFDEWLRVNVLPMEKSFVLKPMIAYQRPRKSEIWNCHSDYTGCHKQGNEWMKKNL